MTKLVVLIGFCIAFAAGLTVGMSRARMQTLAPTTMPSTRPTHRGGTSFLVSELGLTQQQQEQLNKIWSETARGGRGEQEKQRQQLREKRDNDILAIIPAGDKDKYEKVLSDYRDQLTEMDRAMRDRFKKSVEETKQVLTPEQRTKYEEILSRHPFGPPGGSPGRGRGDGRDRETTRRSEPAH